MLISEETFSSSYFCFSWLIAKRLLEEVLRLRLEVDVSIFWVNYYDGFYGSQISQEKIFIMHIQVEIFIKLILLKEISVVPFS